MRRNSCAFQSYKMQVLGVDRSGFTHCGARQRSDWSKVHIEVSERPVIVGLVPV